MARNVDEYISAFSPEVQAVLRQVQTTIQKAAPKAEEIISYQMPAYKQNGVVLVYFGAFKQHLGLYPPVRGDIQLEKACAKYAGPKGNLRFPFAEPVPYALIERIVRLRVRLALS